MGESRLRHLQLGLDVRVRIVAPTRPDDLRGMPELRLIPLHPLRQIGDDDEAVILEPDRAGVLGLLGPALGGAGAVLQIEGGAQLVLDEIERSLLLGEIVGDAGKLRGGQRCDGASIEITDVVVRTATAIMGRPLRRQRGEPGTDKVVGGDGSDGPGDAQRRPRGGPQPRGTDGDVEPVVGPEPPLDGEAEAILGRAHHPVGDRRQGMALLHREPALLRQPVEDQMAAVIGDGRAGFGVGEPIAEAGHVERHGEGREVQRAEGTGQERRTAHWTSLPRRRARCAGRGLIRGLDEFDGADDPAPLGASPAVFGSLMKVAIGEAEIDNKAQWPVNSAEEASDKSRILRCGPMPWRRSQSRTSAIPRWKLTGDRPVARPASP